jgi:hypothetical protein
MGKYAKYQRKSQKKPEGNPIWRGVGCVLIVVVPLISYGLMIILTPMIKATNLVPYELLGRVTFPDWALRAPVLSDLTFFIGGINDLWLKVLAFFVILLLLTTISSLIYTMVFQLIGPPRYTDTDAPPAKYKAKVYRR